METAFKGLKKQLNPELEIIRENALAINHAVEVEKNAEKLIKRTCKIHAGYLFEYPETLQSLCLYLNETQNTSGWEPFGSQLGLKNSYIWCLKYNNFNNEDPAYNILLIYVQQRKATIGAIIKALVNIKRLDVLERVQIQINNIADEVLSQRREVEDFSDYESMHSSKDQSENSDDDEIIRPRAVPNTPFLFKNFEERFDVNNSRIVSHTDSWQSVGISDDNQAHPRCEIARLCQSVKVKDKGKDCITKEKRKKGPYGKKILLTFAADGEKTAQNVAAVLRRKRDDLPRLGVVILSEHVQLLNKNPHVFVASAFFQVDYVCPILTHGYFELITKRSTDSPMLPTSCVDHSYVQYLFDLMNQYYITNNCINDKIRPIMPDELITTLQRNLLLSGPLFTSCWEKSGNAEELAVKLLKCEI